MNTSRVFRAVSLIGFLALTTASQAVPLLGCNVASRTNVDCADIFGATLTEYGVNFFTDTEYYVGYRRGVIDSPDFRGSSTRVSRHSVFATSLEGISTAERGSGMTMVIEFEYEAALTGLVLSGLGRTGNVGFQSSVFEHTPTTEMAHITAYNGQSDIVFDRSVEGSGGYVYVNFGDIVPQISTLLISSVSGVPGLMSANTNVTYFITALPEPDSLLLIITGFGALALRRRFVS